ncbi:DnaJ-like cysteine-rich domain-containing protein [Pseudomonas asplenii]|uniref:DnaJ-like cysteine-rich domain-containing protein n=1 Tax=Pseudomonas asplenii TaxID=53407 RepID=UPI0012FBB058|nr:hypothetical protein [Pseudomonas fuscovaginae]
MSGTAGFTANDIAQAMKAKAEEAFGDKVTSPFGVEAIEQHRAQITYTVTVEHAFEYQSRAVRRATGPLYDQAHIRSVLTQRQNQLLNAPGYLREHTQAQLRHNAARYREPGKFHVLSDNEVYCGVETCHGCTGRGTCNCRTCNGHASHTCTRCHGQCRMTCTGCNGRGSSPTFVSNSPQRCFQCSGSGTVICHGCHGSGRVVCHACRGGQVTCTACDGAGELIYEYHLDVLANTAVNYGWGTMSADWMLPAMREVMNTPERHTVFAVDHYQVDSDNPQVFTASGHVVAAQAVVSHLQASGTCRFIGPKLQAVFLDGVLSGGFKKAVDGVKNHEDIHQVNRASGSKIARQLIREMEQHADVQQTSPVRKGIISAADAAAFMHSRHQALQHIIATRHRFRWGAVLRFALALSAMLTVFYGLMSLLSRQVPSALAGNEGFLGLFALQHNPGSVAAAFLQPLNQLLNSVISKGDYWQLACWLLAALLFNRCFLPKLAPRVWGWAEGRLLRGILLSVPGIVLLNLFMALHPSAYVTLRFTELVPNLHWNGALGRITQWGITYVPQICALSLVISLVRYKAAGVHWGQRMLRVLLQKRDVSKYHALIR